MRLVELKLPRWRADNAEPILPGLGNAFSLVSLALILDGRENNLAFAFSDLERGFSEIAEAEAAAGKDGKGCGWGDTDGSLGELPPDRGNTTLAAAVAAAEDCIEAAPSLS